MSKKSILTRNDKRKNLFIKYKESRSKLKDKIALARSDPSKQSAVFKTMLELDAIPKNSAKCRIRNRCIDTGRARGLNMYSIFGLCSFKLREYANSGFLPGVYKC